MKRWSYMIKIGGTIEEVEESATETIDDIRGVVLESFKPDLQAGVKIDYHSVDISELQSND